MGFEKYVDIERLGTPENDGIFNHLDDDIVVEEKVDGGNGCFFIEDGKLHLCSRNRDMTDERDEKAFSNQQKWLQAHFAEDGKLLEIDPAYFYYIEWMQKHTINYGKEIFPVIGLDIKPKEGAFGKVPYFIGRLQKEQMFEALGIPVVALKGIFKSKELTEQKISELLEKSAYYDRKPGTCIQELSTYESMGKADVRKGCQYRIQRDEQSGLWWVET